MTSLQPLTCLAYFLMVALSMNWNQTPILRGLRTVAPLFLLAGVLANFRFIVPSHYVKEVPGLEDARG